MYYILESEWIKNKKKGKLLSYVRIWHHTGYCNFDNNYYYFMFTKNWKSVNEMRICEYVKCIFIEKKNENCHYILGSGWNKNKVSLYIRIWLNRETIKLPLYIRIWLNRGKNCYYTLGFDWIEEKIKTTIYIRIWLNSKKNKTVIIYKDLTESRKKLPLYIRIRLNKKKCHHILGFDWIEDR